MRDITKEDFIGYPEEVTNLPIYWGEEDEILGWGHLDKESVLEALESISNYHGLDKAELTDAITEEDIKHRHAKKSDIDYLPEDEIAFVFCEADDEGSFPVTYIGF